MAIKIDYNKCTSCGACVENCPVGAINSDIILDSTRCIKCRMCLVLCPSKAINMK